MMCLDGKVVEREIATLVMGEENILSHFCGSTVEGFDAVIWICAVDHMYIYFSLRKAVLFVRWIAYITILLIEKSTKSTEKVD